MATPSFLATFPTTPIARLTGHNGPVHAVAFSAGSGKYILTGSQDRNVRLFNPSTNHLIQTYKAHGYEVLDIAVAQDNRSFVSVGGDKTVFFWDVETAQATRRFTGHSARVNTCTFGGQDDSVIVTGSFDGTCKVWDVKARSDSRPIMSFGDARDAVSDVKVVGHEIFAASIDGRVRVYDLATGYIDTDIVAPGKGITSIAPTQAGDGYLTSCLDSKLRFMDRPSGRCLKTLEDNAFTNAVYRIRATMAFGDAVAICGSENGQIVAWDVLTGQVLHRLRHKEQDLSNDSTETSKRDVVSAVTWNQLRKQWASAGGDGCVVVWGMKE
jgi:mitogen-activated protein kinase organizer 1